MCMVVITAIWGKNHQECAKYHPILLHSSVIEKVYKLKSITALIGFGVSYFDS